MGKAGDFVRKTAREAALARMNSMFSVSSTSPPFIQIGCLNANQTKVTLTDGTEWNVIIKGKIAGRCNPVVRLNATTFYMLGDESKAIESHSSVTAPWMIVGPDPLDTTLPFPEFNLVDPKTWTSYRIPKESLSTIYDTSLDSHQGVWSCALSLNKKYITITRTAITNNFPDLSTESEDVRIYCTVISNFKLDAEHNLVDLTNATITNKVQNYVNDTPSIDPTSLPPPEGFFWVQNGAVHITPLFPPSATLPNTVDCAGRTYTFNGFNSLPSFSYRLFPRTVIGYDSSGIPIVNVVGYWQNLASAFATWINPVTGLPITSAFYCHGGFNTIAYSGVVSEIKDQGLWLIKDFMGTAEHSITTDHIAPFLESYTYTPKILRPDWSASTSGVSASESFRSLAFSSLASGANGATDNNETTDYYETPFGTVVSSRPATFGPDPTAFAIDNLRIYGAFDSTTKWITDSASVKVTRAEKFVDVRRTTDGALQFKRWSYDATQATISGSTSITSPKIPDGFGLLTLASGTITTYYIVDWQIA